jgi:hypothetical protein
MVFSLPALPPDPPPAAIEPVAARRAAAPVDDLFRESERREPERTASRRTARDDDRDDRARDEPRTRRTKARKSGGSALPWVLGVGGAVMLLFLVCGGAIAIIAVAAFSGGKAGQAPIIAVGGGGEKPIQVKQGAGKRIQLVNGQFTTSTQLTRDDPFDPDNKEFRCKLFQVDLQPGRTYTIDMTTPNAAVFDPYLRIEDQNEAVLAQDDDSGGNLNARIRFVPNGNGPYIIVATCFRPNQFGPFTLTIRDTTGGK